MPCLILVMALAAGLAGCATESHKAVVTGKGGVGRHAVLTAPRAPWWSGKFDNRSPYLRGLFSDGVTASAGRPRRS